MFSTKTLARTALLAAIVSAAPASAWAGYIDSDTASPVPDGSTFQLYSPTPVPIPGFGSTNVFYIHYTSTAPSYPTFTPTETLVKIGEFSLTPGGESLAGMATFTTDRTAPNQTGPYTERLTQALFEGTFGIGTDQVHVRLEVGNNSVSSGDGRIDPISGGRYRISNNHIINNVDYQYTGNDGILHDVTLPTLTAQLLPEPTTLALLTPGLLALAGRRRVAARA